MPKTRRRQGLPGKPSRRKAGRPVTATLFCQQCSEPALAAYLLSDHLQFAQAVNRGELTCGHCGGALGRKPPVVQPAAAPKIEVVDASYDVSKLANGNN